MSFYHLLDSLVPPSPELAKANKQWLSSLEKLCAVSIAKYRRSQDILSHTPQHIQKVIWRAYLADKYYTYDSNFDELPQLLLSWQNEDFVLKELMPSFPPNLESFKNGNPGDCLNIRVLCSYFGMVKDAIISTVTKDSGLEGSGHAYFKIRKIDISGLSGYETMNEDINILDKIENVQNVRNSSGQIEIVIDFHIDIDDKFYAGIAAGTNRLTTNMYSNTCNTIILKFNHISVSVDAEQSFNEFQRLLANVPISVELFGDNDGSNISEQFIKKHFPQDNIREVMLDHCACSLSFLHDFKNVVHVDLLDCNLHGKLDALGKMDRGLVLLNMSNCQLENSDLGHLLGSIHESTLKELDLSCNRFYRDENISNLIELCKNLTNVLYFDLDHTGLDDWSVNEMESFYHSFRLMPNIVVLKLCGSIPSNINIYTMKNLITILKENLSLRYVSLGTFQAEEEYENIEDLFAEIHQKANVNRSQLLHVEIFV